MEQGCWPQADLPGIIPDKGEDHFQSPLLCNMLPFSIQEQYHDQW